MAVYPKAKYRPLNQFSNVNTQPTFGVAFHVNDSGSVSQSPTSLYNWIAGNPSRPNDQMSCHFQLMSDGSIEQYIDTVNGSWCQEAGNDTHISVETQGLATEEMNAAMVASFGALMEWIHTTHGIPLVATTDISVRGLVPHGAGGAAWGGHYTCPGVRVNQMNAIIAAAKPAPPKPVIEDDMLLLIQSGKAIYQSTGFALRHMSTTVDVVNAQAFMKGQGYTDTAVHVTAKPLGAYGILMQSNAASTAKVEELETTGKVSKAKKALEKNYPVFVGIEYGDELVA